jgi:hypothetical protein
LSPSLSKVLFIVALLLGLGSGTQAGDLSVVPLLNGERSDALNLWGGPFGTGNITSVAKQGSIVHTGSGAYRANLGSIPDDGFRFFQTFSSAVTSAPGFRQDRDLTQYETLEGYVRNDTTAPLTFSLELKDYRDSGSYRAVRNYTIPAGAAWTKIEAPLDLSNGWTVSGTPDLRRTFAVSFLVDADFGPATGSLYLDDFNLIEKGPGIDVATAPIHSIVERLAKRQFTALWAARNKTSGIIPNVSTDVQTGALNTTTGVVWLLPSAVRRGWVSQSDANAYMGQVVNSLNVNRNQTTYLPTRFLNLVTAAPQGGEESSIDASFIALALHNYKSQPTTPPALRDAIDAVQNRFNFAAFAESPGFNLAYNPATGFTPYHYSGYTHEGKVIALAAEVSDAHHVPLETMWNKDTGRVLDYLVDPNQDHLVYSYGTDHRAPFAQALINLFVDTRQRGADNYPNRALARNPWQNFVRYEAEVAARLEQLGREELFQPDAARGAGAYRPWNLYNDFGQPNLFQPWSVALALMAGAPGAEQSLRFLLDNGLVNGLDGPLGLADSAQWATGAANPTDVPSLADNWNMVLSTMALMEFLEGPNRPSAFFANLPEVDAALDLVFVAGDYSGNGVVNAVDYTQWRSTFGSQTRLAADGNNDGSITAADYVIWRKHSAAGSAAAMVAVPEPNTATWAILLALVVLGRRIPARRETTMQENQ